MDAAQVDRRMARGFLDAEESRGISDKTWNDALKRVRATFRFLQTEYGLWRNPFEGIRMREEHHQHRKPLSEGQVQRLLEAVRDDDFCRPLVLCGLSTAMRLGDCCQLRWADVDLGSASPSVTVKTSKTGETVCIPVYERLRAELEMAHERRGAKGEFVWPQQAELYRRQHSLVSRRMGVAFKKAVGEDLVHAVRKHGLLKASVYDFHSLRTTWITEALSRGVPIETVKLISGHKTVEVVTTHYFHPDRDQVRNALQNGLPSHITGIAKGKDSKLLGAGGGSEETGRKAMVKAIAVLSGVTGKANRERVEKAVRLIEGAMAAADGVVFQRP